MNVETCANIIRPVIGFIFGFAAAVFAEPLRRYIFRPKLEMEFGDTNDFKADTPEVRQMPDGSLKEGPAYYIRGRVVNKSVNIAKQCMVYLTNIERRSERTGLFDQTIFCESIPLHWSCRGPENAFSYLDLPKGVNQYFDIFSTRQGDTMLHLQILIKPFRYNNLFQEQGTYRFTVQVSGEGFSPISMKIIVQWKCIWNDFVLGKEE
jgi:hypothetical protein